MSFQYILMDNSVDSLPGQVTDVMEIATNKRRAMKVYFNVKDAKKEAACYLLLQGCKEFPRLRWWGQIGSCGVLVMDYITIDLQELHKRYQPLFTPKEVAALAVNMASDVQ